MIDTERIENRNTMLYAIGLIIAGSGILSLTVGATYIICNSTASAAVATVKWGDGSTDYDVIAGKSIAANSSEVYDLMLPLRENHTVKVTSGTGNALTFSFVIVSTGSTLYGPGNAAS